MTAAAHSVNSWSSTGGHGHRKGDGEQRVMRRYFFGEHLPKSRAGGKDQPPSVHSMPSVKTFDVRLPSGELEGGPVEQGADNVRYRYLDFLDAAGTSGQSAVQRALGDAFEAPPVAAGEAGQPSTADAKEVAEWLRTAVPSTRFEAYPLYVLMKGVLLQLLEGELLLQGKEAAALREQLEAAEGEKALLVRQLAQERQQSQKVRVD